LKYISDSFEDHFTRLKSNEGEYKGVNPEDPYEYKAVYIFFVPTKARWNLIQSSATKPNFGKIADDAMNTIENRNPSLKGVLPKVYAKQNLDPTSLGGLIDLISNISMANAIDRSAGVLGHGFESFLGEFALGEGKKVGQFYTPMCIIELFVEMLEPTKERF
jgi:type I restriction enzyme M protein